jgi:hypothetical protein
VVGFQSSLRDEVRTGEFFPALKRRAIVGCPSGAFTCLCGAFECKTKAGGVFKGHGAARKYQRGWSNLSGHEWEQEGTLDLAGGWKYEARACLSSARKRSEPVDHFAS